MPPSKYQLSDIVVVDGKPYVVIGYEYSFNQQSYVYELSPYSEESLIFEKEDSLELAD